MLSYGFWQAHYAGDPAVLGRTLQLDTHLFKIVGITPPRFFGVDVGRFFDVAVPLCSSTDRPTAKTLSVIGRPKPGLTLPQVEARLKALGPAVFEATLPPGNSAQQQQYLRNNFTVERAGHGISSVRIRYGGPLTILMVVAGLALLIACANIASLLLARALARQKEIGIQLALGAGRSRLIRQWLTESVLLAGAGAVLGLLLPSWSGMALLRLISKQRIQVNLDLTIDGRLLAFTASVALLTAILFGIVPAFRATSIVPHMALKQSGRDFGGAHGLPLGSALVVFQISLSFVLLAGARLFLRTFENLLTQDMGFDRDQVLLINADIRNAHYPPGRRQGFFDAVLEEISAVPGVRSASQSGMTPIGASFWIGPRRTRWGC